MTRRKAEKKSSMACYVRIGESVDTEELVEVPTENDGTLLLSSVSAQFPDSVGLRYKTESGSWRGVRVQDNIIDPPLEGWGDSEYYVIKKTLKREAGDNSIGPTRKLNKTTKDDVLPDLMVANLPFSATDAEVREHFESFGELDMCEVKHDNDGKSRGFGFMRYKTMEAVEEALSDTHIINNRKCELRYSKRSQGQQRGEDNVQTKLFIGRLAPGTTTTDLQEQFSPYGVLKDAYIPHPFRGYGFVTFASQTVANTVLNETHEIKGRIINVSYPNEKRMPGMFGQPNPGFGNMQGGGFGNMQNAMQMGSGQMGSGQSNMSDGMNTQPWMQGKMPTQNGSSNLGPNLGYGFQQNGNYGNLGGNSVWAPKSLP